MTTVSLARHAMATRFEIVLCGEDPIALRAAGEEALDEIDRLENQLSLFRPSSEIAHLNALAARQPVQVTPRLFALLRQALQLSSETAGAFDITVAPLVRAWGFWGQSGNVPSPETLAAARQQVGSRHVLLNSENRTVHFDREGLMLDLGAIGKGYAIDQAAQILREAGVTSALLHGGTSSVFALGSPPDAQHWTIAIADPRNRDALLSPLSSSPSPNGVRPHPQGAPPAPFATVHLKDESLAVSAIWGKTFQAQGRSYGHVIDPRTGTPVEGSLLAAVILPSATETDALSTALLTLGPTGHCPIQALRTEMRSLVVAEANGELTFAASGIAASSLD
jgi:FAD:protein FMN transferase